jgi:membrane peptidoglycan carboxypeptidase
MGRDLADANRTESRTLNLRPFRKRTEPPGERPPKTRPKHRRRKRRLAALGLVAAILAVTAFTIGSVFYVSVDLPEDFDEALSQGSTVYYSDGTTVMGELAAEQRTSVHLDDIADDVEWALVAAEDANFYEHPGVDAKGVLRALVNNLKGGDQQGASTLTQQYAGLVADIRGDGSYLRKAREAAMAMKMEDEFTKDEILNHYLNIVYFGRGAYGVEAAAQAFFGRSAADLSTSQAALLVAQIKSPDGPYDPRDPYGQGGSVETATDRWEYVLDQMVATGKLDQVKRDALTDLPETLDPTDDPEGLGPEGFVTNGFVLRALADAGIGTEEVLRGGFDIVTTLDAELQRIALDQTGIRDVGATDEKIAAGLAAVEPGTGRVLAYYGGENGAGLDQADDVGHRPGTAFNTVTALAALQHGMSLWSPDLDGSSPQTFATYLDEDGEPKELVNIGGAGDDAISLADAVTEKLDTPVYAVAERLGGDAIADTAADLGIDRMWDPHDLDEHGIAAEIVPGDDAARFQPDVGIGAYPITVLDAATMHATLASGGIAAEPYFVEHVTGPDGERRFAAEPDVVGDAVEPWMAGEVTLPLYDNAYSAGHDDLAVNASATWHTGFTPALALAVWAGDETKEGDGSSHEGTVAEAIWWKLMESRPDRYRDAEAQANLPEEAGEIQDGGSPPYVEEAPSDDASDDAAQGEDPTDQDREEDTEGTDEENTGDETGEDGDAPTTDDVTVEPTEDSGWDWFD